MVHEHGTGLSDDAHNLATIQEQSDVLADHLWKRRSFTIYKIRVSVLYHLKRARFFNTVDKSISIVTALSATAAVGALLKGTGDWELRVAAITAALALVPLVFTLAERSRKHEQVASEFLRLQAQCLRAGEHWSIEQCDELEARAVELEASESAPLSALVADCQSQLNIATGRPEDRIYLKWYHRWFKNWFDFDPTKIDEYSKKRKKVEAAKSAAR